MADLIKAATTRLGYAANELKSGDGDAALGHLLKAQEYTARAAAQIAPTADDDLDLSPNQQEAIGQLFAKMGLDLATTHSEGELLEAEEKAGIDNAILALAGFFTPQNGVRNPNVDYRLVDKFKTTAPDGGIVDKPEYAAEGAWAAYISGV